MNLAKNSFFDGCKSGVPIAIGYLPIAIAFGLLAKSVGIPNETSILMSLVVFAGASQFMAVNLIASGVYLSEIIFTTFMLNLRHFLMTASLGQKVEKISLPWRFLLSFGVTDETFTVASLREEQILSKNFLFGLNFIAYLFWNFGTWIGLFLSNSIPDSIQQSMGIALYAMFIGLLVPAIRGSKQVLFVVLVAVVVQSLLTYLPWIRLISPGWKIILATVFAAGAGAILFPKKEEKG